MMTIRQAAEKWSCSVSLVRKWIAQGRLEVIQPGREILVLWSKKPKALKRGSLTEDQRVAWKR